MTAGMTMTPMHRAERRLTLSALMLAAGLLGGAAAAQTAAPTATSAPPFVEQLASRAQVDALRRGGFVLYMRHGSTDNSRADQVPVDLDDCSTQRVLNDEGRALARQVGEALRRARIPIGEVVHSPLCRARETAELAFPELPRRSERLLMYTANLSRAQKQPVLEMTRRLLSEPVPAGSNRMVVAHAPNMADLIGYFVKPEGTVLIVLPQGNGRFEYLASIPPAQWPQLLGDASR